MNPARLNTAWWGHHGNPAVIAGGVQWPAYRPGEHGVGIVHLGPGAFHRAHQAVYTDTALAACGGDWRVTGVSLRSRDVARALNPQDGLYTVLERGPRASAARVIGSVAGVLALADQPEQVRQALVAPGTRIVSLTVTEKAYGIQRASGHIIESHPAVVHDLQHPEAPTGVLGLLLWALRERKRRASAPFTVLCCDNLPENGRLLRAGVLDMARHLAPQCQAWIIEQVAFPGTMVDRITPASTAATLDDARKATGCIDLAAVETEPFSMWVIEDHFPQGRPAWEQAGAQLTHDVTPYEQMKLRMLNGAHSLLAYTGHVAGHALVRDAMADPVFEAAVRRHLQAAASSLSCPPAMDLGAYAQALMARFSNPAIAHQTAQIAMDGTEKMPQRILIPAAEVLARSGDLRPFALATAAWMRYCLGRTDAGGFYSLQDPRAEEIIRCLQGQAARASHIVAALQGLPGLFPASLCQTPQWKALVAGYLDRMLAAGVRSTLGELC
ncbi:mannitol dehydrogenase family protein [Castellaniella sp.]|uniref:mannitol dehydrogenase family protein n=1 Tax=Castellaniella sp. TaxID=1955812 RepID=UPI00355EE129